MHDVANRIPLTMPEAEHLTKPFLRPDIITLLRIVTLLCFAVAMIALCVQLWREKQGRAKGMQAQPPQQPNLDELLARSRARRKQRGTRKHDG